MRPLLSIIIPTFNAGQKLAHSLESVTTRQKPFDSLEVLVMDAASTDDTLAIGQKWAVGDARIQIWSEPDEGIYDGMNKGIEQSRGRFLYFLGAGDLVRSGAFEAFSHLPNLHPLLLIHGQTYHEGANVAPGAGADLGVVDLARYNIPHQATFYGRQIFERVGLYEPKYRLYGDHEFNFRCWTTPGIEKRFWSYIVADFEGGGASSSRYDPDFDRDWPRLVWRRGGLWPWLAFQISHRVPVEKLGGLQRVRSLARAVKRRQKEHAAS